jgi:transcriptional regulator with XRE-family HTH domain
VPNSIPVKATKFGEWLQLRRKQRGRTHGELAHDVRNLVKPTGLQVSKSQIVALEQGRVPSWPLLAALSRVYESDIRETVLLLIDALEFPGSADLLRPRDGVQRASNPQVEDARDESLGGGGDQTLSRSETDAIVRAVEGAAQLLRLSDELRDLAHSIAGRQATSVSDASSDRAARPRKNRRRAAG